MSFQLGLADGYGRIGEPRAGHPDTPLEFPSAGLELEAEVIGWDSCALHGPLPGDVLGIGPAGEPATSSPHHHPGKLSERDQSHGQPKSRDLAFPLCDHGQPKSRDLTFSLCDLGQVTRLL